MKNGIFRNKWFKFCLVSFFYILLFVVWTGNLWLLLGLLVIYDIYISKYIQRLFWNKHREIKKRNRTYKKSMEWVEAIVYAVVVTTFIRFFFFAMYVIPTPSMEKTLLVGDYLLVSKVAYGPSVPNTPISFPLVHNTMPLSQTKKSYSESIKWKYHRLKGFGGVERGDVVVFNFPAGDTVIQEMMAATYYDVLRSYQYEYGHTEWRIKLFSDFNIIAHPVDKRENYVKRCVALPGDSLTIRDGAVYVNGETLKTIPGLQQVYTVYTASLIGAAAFDKMQIPQRERYYNRESGSYRLPLTEENLSRIQGLKNIIKIVPDLAQNPDVWTFPHVPAVYPWNRDNYGPLWIPRKGVTVPIDTGNLPLYSRIINAYEGHTLEVQDEIIYIDGTPADNYTFAMDYYFMMGDNRHNSADSRFWGFVPEDHIVGKASYVWMSLDEDRKFPANIRWSRLFRKIR